MAFLSLVGINGRPTLRGFAAPSVFVAPPPGPPSVFVAPTGSPFIARPVTPATQAAPTVQARGFVSTQPMQRVALTPAPVSYTPAPTQARALSAARTAHAFYGPAPLSEGAARAVAEAARAREALLSSPAARAAGATTVEEAARAHVGAAEQARADATALEKRAPGSFGPWTPEPAPRSAPQTGVMFGPGPSAEYAPGEQGFFPWLLGGIYDFLASEKGQAGISFGANLALGTPDIVPGARAVFDILDGKGVTVRRVVIILLTGGSIAVGVAVVPGFFPPLASLYEGLESAWATGYEWFTGVPWADVVLRESNPQAPAALEATRVASGWGGGRQPPPLTTRPASPPAAGAQRGRDMTSREAADQLERYINTPTMSAAEKARTIAAWRGVAPEDKARLHAMYAR